jgi:hypothetical protein
MCGNSSFRPAQKFITGTLVYYLSILCFPNDNSSHFYLSLRRGTQTDFVAKENLYHVWKLLFDCNLQVLSVSHYV